MASITGCLFWELIGCLTLDGANYSNVDDNLNVAYLEPFIGILNMSIAQNINKEFRLCKL